MKRCCTCQEIKTTDQYTKDKHTRDGLCRRCKSCTSAYGRGFRRPDTRTTEERFWSKVDKSGDCWIWLGAKSHSQGRPDRLYGVFGHDKKQSPAHRYAYEITYGPISKELLACHKCDNPLCVRPDHIFPGTPAENTADMIHKGRQAPGPRHRSFQKLTSDQVLEIVRLNREEGINQRAIAKRYGVHYVSINAIMNGHAWADVTGIQPKARRTSSIVA